MVILATRRMNTRQQMWPLIRSNIATVDNWFHQILAFLYSDISPEDALKPKPKESENQTSLDFN